MSLRQRIAQLAARATPEPADDSPPSPETLAELDRLFDAMCARVEAGEAGAAEQYAQLLADLEARAAEHEA